MLGTTFDIVSLDKKQGLLLVLIVLISFYIYLVSHKIRNVLELLHTLIKVKMHSRRHAGKYWSFVDMLEEKDSGSNRDEVLFVTVEDEKSWTRRDLDIQANQVAHWLHSQGVKQKTTVALMLQNRPELVSFWMGAAKLGAATALLNTNVSGNALKHCVMSVLGAQVGKKLLVLDEELRTSHTESIQELETEEGVRCVFFDDLLEELQSMALTRPDPSFRSDVRESDPLIYIYTSGTTGLPKACVISSTRFTVGGFPLSVFAKLTSSSRIYNALPLYHSAAGILGCSAVLQTGATMYLRRKFSVRHFSPDVAKFKCTVMQYIGEFARYLANQESPVTEGGGGDEPIRIEYAMGNGLAADIWPKFTSKYNIGRVIEFYSSTEGNIALFNSSGKVGAVGYVPRWLDFMYPVKLLMVSEEDQHTPVRGEKGRCSIALTDDLGLAANRINTKGGVDQRFDGYAGAGSDKANSSKLLTNVLQEGDAFFNSGDLMKRDKEGFFYFGDRVGDTYRWKGENVSTAEVEAVIGGVKGVVDTCVYGVQVPGYDGRAGMACIVLESNLSGASFDWALLHEALKAHLPTYARPSFYRITERIPVTSTFKHLRSQLAKEGYDPELLTDKGDVVHLVDPKGGPAKLITLGLFKSIENGTAKL